MDLWGQEITPCVLLFLSTQLFHLQKYFLLLVAVIADLITKGKVFDKVCIS